MPKKKITPIRQPGLSKNRLTPVITYDTLYIPEKHREIGSACRGYLMPSGAATGRQWFLQTLIIKEGKMPIYVMMTNLTDEGRKTVKANPQRIKEVNKEVEAMGVKILAQYVVLGQYDFINILDAPSNEAVARVATELSSRGTLQTTTLAAMTLDEFIDSLKR